MDGMDLNERPTTVNGSEILNFYALIIERVHDMDYWTTIGSVESANIIVR